MWTIERREVRDLARRPANDMPRQLLVRHARRRIAEPESEQRNEVASSILDRRRRQQEQNR